MADETGGKGGVASGKNNCEALSEPLLPPASPSAPGRRHLQSHRRCCCSLDGLAFRSCVLILIGVLTFGSYFAYDQPAGLPGPVTHILARNTTEGYGLLYSVYSAPNVFLPFIGGWLIDHVLGVRASTILCVALVAAGNVIVALAATIGIHHGADVAFYTAVAGRFVFGVGGETLTVAQSKLCTRWFRSHERATAFAIVLALSRAGSALNIQTESMVYRTWDLTGVVWIAAGICGVSLICGLVLTGLDRLGESSGTLAVLQQQSPGKRTDDAGLPAAGDEARVAMDSFVDSSGSSSLIPQDKDEQDADSLTLWERVVDIRNVLRPREALIYSSALMFYLAVLVFVSYGKKIFDNKFPGCADQSSLDISLPYYISAGLTTIFGLVIDRCGRSILWVLASCISLVGVHSFVMFSGAGVTGACPHTPLIASIWLGITYSCYAAVIWPMVAIIVPPKRCGTAYGLMTAIQNAGFAFVPSIFGIILDQTKSDPSTGYDTMQWVFVLMSASALLLSVALFCVDQCADGALLRSGSATASDD